MTYDHVHPNIAGQLFMMERWHKAIVDNLMDSKKPVLKGKIEVSELISNSARIDWPWAVDNYGISKYEIWEGKKLLGSVPFSSTTFKISDIKQVLCIKLGYRQKLRE